LFDGQLDTRFAELLNRFLPVVFPMMSDILGPHLSYYWTLWQSEWATDFIFDSPASLNPLMGSLLRHAHVSGTSSRVLRYLDRPLTKAGKPYANSTGDVITRVGDFNDGIRLRHWVDKNSVKLYNEQNVLRLETTINDPCKFMVYRHKQGQSPDKPKQRLPLRKGVMDIPLRAKISQPDFDSVFEEVLLLRMVSRFWLIFWALHSPSSGGGRVWRAGSGRFLVNYSFQRSAVETEFS
jgi:hypothetical protein